MTRPRPHRDSPMTHPAPTAPLARVTHALSARTARTAADLAHRAGCSRAQARDALRHLTKAGVAERDGRTRWRLDPDAADWLSSGPEITLSSIAPGARARHVDADTRERDRILSRHC